MTRNAIFTICWAQMKLCLIVQEADCVAGLSGLSATSTDKRLDSSSDELFHLLAEMCT